MTAMGDDLQTLEVDVLFVGGGPANLAGALRLTQLVSQHNVRAASKPGGRDMTIQIALIEKGRDCGAHAVSGAIFNPVALAELLPNYQEQGFPFSTRVGRHGLHLLTARRQFHIPDMLIPPAYRQDGCYVGSLQQLNLWLAARLESAGVYVFHETCGVEVLYDGDRICGVRTGAKGLEAGGGRKSNYEPGTTIRAKVTVFGEGPRGTLAEDVIHRFKLRTGRNPQIGRAHV